MQLLSTLLPLLLSLLSLTSAIIVAPLECTKTVTLPANHLDLAHTTTVYATTVTQTHGIDCHWCKLTTVTPHYFGYGPVRFISATATRNATTVRETVCRKSPVPTGTGAGTGTGTGSGYGYYNGGGGPRGGERGPVPQE